MPEPVDDLLKAARAIRAAIEAERVSSDAFDRHADTIEEWREHYRTAMAPWRETPELPQLGFSSDTIALLIAQTFENDAQQLEYASGWILSCDEPGSIERSIELARAILGVTA